MPKRVWIVLAAVFTTACVEGWEPEYAPAEVVLTPEEFAAAPGDTIVYAAYQSGGRGSPSAIRISTTDEKVAVVRDQEPGGGVAVIVALSVGETLVVAEAEGAVPDTAKLIVSAP